MCPCGLGLCFICCCSSQKFRRLWRSHSSWAVKLCSTRFHACVMCTLHYLVYNRSHCLLPTHECTRFLEVVCHSAGGHCAHLAMVLRCHSEGYSSQVWASVCVSNMLSSPSACLLCSTGFAMRLMSIFHASCSCTYMDGWDRLPFGCT